MNKELRITVVAIVALAMVLTVGIAGNIQAKKHHLTDTQKEDSTSSDIQGRPCNFGPDHDQCRLQFEQSKSGLCTFGPDHNECFKEAWDNDS